MNRRGFMGLLGGAVAAGPKLAAGIAENAAPSMGYYPTSIEGEMSIASDPSYVASRIASLKDIIAGKDPSTKREQRMSALYQLESLERYRLDGLRSVAAQHKVRMLVSGGATRQDRIRRTNAEFELADLITVKLPF